MFQRKTREVDMLREVIDQKMIQDITDKIIAHFQPKRIVLFGSQAGGGITSQSDVDLFIVMESKLRRDHRAREISKLFSNRLFPLDIIVYTADEVERSLKRGNPFVQEIMTRGKVLYAAA